MGILGLAKLVADIAPSSIRESEIKTHFGEFLSQSCVPSFWIPCNFANISLVTAYLLESSNMPFIYYMFHEWHYY